MKKYLNLILLAAFFNPHLSIAQSVGTIDGVFNVSDIGAASYSIPLDVPEGLGGLTPSLALVYNSQGANGIAGMGWALVGLSSVSRTKNNIYNDNRVQGLTLDYGDHFFGWE